MSTEMISYDPGGVLLSEHGLAAGDLANLAGKLRAARDQVLADARLWAAGEEVPEKKRPLDAGFFELPERLLAEYRDQGERSEVARILENALDTLSGREWGYLPKDVYAGLMKASFTAWVMAGVGCAQGLRARGGALGVGRAVRSAVIISIVLTLIISYNFSWVAYQAFPS